MYQKKKKKKKKKSVFKKIKNICEKPVSLSLKSLIEIDKLIKMKNTIL